MSKLMEILFTALLVSSSQAQVQNSAILIEAKSGRYAGTAFRSRDGREYFAFTGIPYAYPPVRFEPSTLFNGTWEGIWDARSPGSKCPQAASDLQNEGREIEGHENCLNLNVYVPKEGIDSIGNHLPVMVYIHEGLFSSGEGVAHGAKYFMDHNIVLVSINYRLGVLGFLNTGDREVTGNMGLKDCVVALKWLRENVESFGGDPELMTIFGNDAGAAIVSLLLISPSARGLFSGAIAQSGSSLVPWAWQTNPKDNSKKLGELLNCPNENSKVLVSCLRTKSVQEIGRAQMKFTKWFRDPIATFVPSKETNIPGREAFLSDHPLTILLRGQLAAVPLLIGVVEDEGLPQSIAILNDERRLNEINNEWYKFAPITLMYEDIISKQDRSRISTAVSQFYFGGDFIKGDTQQNLTNLYTDRYFLRGIKLSALLHARVAPVYPYIFSYKGEYSNLVRIGERRYLGVAHLDELQYLFNTQVTPEFVRGSQAERVSKNLVRLWTSFATTGAPGESSAINRQQWRPVQRGESEGRLPFKWYNIDSTTRLINEPFTKRLQSWNILETTWTNIPRLPTSSIGYTTRFNSPDIGTTPSRQQGAIAATGNIFSQLINGVSNSAFQFLDIFGSLLSGLAEATSTFQRHTSSRLQEYINRNQNQYPPNYSANTGN